MSPMIKQSLVVLFLVLFITPTLRSQEKPLAQTASTDSLKKVLRYIASDELRGRYRGTKDEKKAASYLANIFSSYHLKRIYNGEDSSYYQKFLLTQTPFPSSKIICEGVTPRIDIFTNIYFACARTYANPQFIPFIGTKSQYSPNDTQVLLAKGVEDAVKAAEQQIAVNQYIRSIMVGIPDSLYTVFQKSNILRIFTNSAITENGDTLLMTYSKKSINYTKSDYRKYILPFVKRYPNNILIITCESVIKKLFTDNVLEKFGSIEHSEGKTFKVAETLTPDITRFRNSLNVIAKLEGKSKEEAIVVSAHYDHIGIMHPKPGEEALADSICNGADDNGSGTAAVMEVARMFAEAKAKGYQPKRSIYFVTFSGEEGGLIGSYAFVNNPVIPIGSVKANINLDMVGRTDNAHSDWDKYVYTIPLVDSIGLAKSCTIAASMAKIKIDDKFNDNDRVLWIKGSDHYSFVEKSIPAVVITTGMHPDYHKPSDEVSKIIFSRLARISTFSYYLAWELANR